MASLSLTGQTAGIATTQILALPTVGQYRASISSYVQAVGTARTQTCFITATPASSTTYSSSSMSLTSATATITAVFTMHVGVGNMYYCCSQTGATGSPTYGLDVVIERLQ